MAVGSLAGVLGSASDSRFLENFPRTTKRHFGHPTVIAISAITISRRRCKLDLTPLLPENQRRLLDRCGGATPCCKTYLRCERVHGEAQDGPCGQNKFAPIAECP